jgi:thiol-disulfide isomerase/thioredoxin
MKRSRVRKSGVVSGLLIAGLAASFTSDRGTAMDLGKSAPEFTHVDAAHWLNSPPLSIATLRGHVVLVEFWAFDCVNCLRSLPWLHGLYDKYRDRGLIVVGVHTPELARERVADNVRRATTSLDIRYPVMIDDDYSYWQAIGNQYWPAFYLLDRAGRIQLTRIGETHPRDANATLLESAIEAQLAAPAP